MLCHRLSDGLKEIAFLREALGYKIAPLSVPYNHQGLFLTPGTCRQRGAVTPCPHCLQPDSEGAADLGPKCSHGKEERARKLKILGDGF